MSNNGISINLDKIKIIVDLPWPKNVKEVQKSILGIMGEILHYGNFEIEEFCVLWDFPINYGKIINIFGSTNICVESSFSRKIMLIKFAMYK